MSLSTRPLANDHSGAADSNHDASPGGVEAAASRLRRWMMVGFGALVVLAETMLFFFLVPSAEEVSALAEARLIQSVQMDAAAAKQRSIDENTVEEFDLGVFGETFSPIDTPDRYRVEMRLFALVRKKDLSRMQQEFESKRGRLRHAIRMRVRNSELVELDENQLGLLERRILTACNHLLDDDMLLGVGFLDYQLIQQ
ncbi:MAG: dihydrolipoamide acetyltransferase [Planctomycetota bacterium]